MDEIIIRPFFLPIPRSVKNLFFIIVLCVAVMHSAFGQAIDYKKIILPDDALNTSFEEKLVQLAWRNNPESHLATEVVTQSKEEAKVASRQWATMIGVQGNLNEFNFKQTITGQDQNLGAAFFPRYNVFVQLPLSTFVTLPHNRNAAVSRLRQSEEKVNQFKLELRARVLKLYADYKTAETIAKLRRQTMDDEESTYLLIEQRFKNGEAAIEDYLGAQRNRNELRVQQVLAENELTKAKLDIEAVIGVKLEDVR